MFSTIRRQIAAMIAPGESAGQMIAGIYPGGTGPMPRRGTAELLQAYADMPWLRAVVNKVSRSVAEVNWKILVERGASGRAVRNLRIQRASFDNRAKMLKQKQDEIEEIDDHPLLALLTNGNPYLTGSQVIQVAQIHLDLAGDAMLLKERNAAGVPIALWPIPPDWVRETPVFGIRDSFRVSFRGWNGDIPASEILWISDPNPANPYGRGTGTARALGDELEVDEYSAKHTSSWFRNGARPDVIVTMEEGGTKEEAERLELKWTEKHGGFWRRFKPMFTSAKLDVKELSQSFDSMSITELRKFERDAIHQVYGVPPEVLGIVENSNRATIESGEFLYTKHVISPRLEALRTAFQERLVPEFDERIIIDYDSPVTEDKEYRLNVVRAAQHFFTQNEVRELGGFKEKEDGDIYMVPFNLFPTDSLDSGASSQPAPEKGKSAVIRKEDANGADDSLIERVVAAIYGAAMLDEIRPSLQEAIRDFGNRAMQGVGSSGEFYMQDPAVDYYLRTESVSRVQGLIDETTRNDLRETLAEGVANGETIRNLSGRIETVFDDAKGRRARIIARTETVRAANFGTDVGFRQAGVPQKQWLSSRDAAVRDSHAIGSGLDGQTISTGGMFKSPITGAEAPHPGAFGIASEDINCRCIEVAVFEESDIRDYSEEQKIAMWKYFEANRMTHERSMIAAVRRGFDKQEEAALAALRGENEA